MSRSLVRSAVVVLGIVVAGCGSSQSKGSGDTRPAASVNGTPIPMAAYNTQVTLLRNQARTQSTTGIDPCDGGQTFAPYCHKLKQSALDNLIGTALVTQYAQSHHITVSSADFNRQWTVIMHNKFHDDQAVLRAYAKSAGLTVGDIRTFTYQDLLREAVLYHITKHMSRYAPSVRLSRINMRDRKELKLVEQLLKTGRPFNQVAQVMRGNLRSLCAKQGCGELGWIPEAFVPPAERQMLAAARDGSVLGPFAGQAGYALIQVEGHETHRRLSPTQEIGMRERLFANWLVQQENRASVRRYVAT